MTSTNFLQSGPLAKDAGLKGRSKVEPVAVPGMLGSQDWQELELGASPSTNPESKFSSVDVEAVRGSKNSSRSAQLAKSSKGSPAGLGIAAGKVPSDGS
jgi:hypothetical protein